MSAFQEYLDSRGNTVLKAKVDASGGDPDMPTPKAKEDPHKTKAKKNAQVKESAQVKDGPGVSTSKRQYAGMQPQVKSENKPPIGGKATYNKNTMQVKEYINAQGKLVTSPPTSEVPDYTGPSPAAPEKGATKGKNWSSAATVGTPAPYKSAAESKISSGETGFGDLGDKSLKYEPDTKFGPSKMVPGGKVLATWKSESFINKTSSMNASEFTKHMASKCSTLGETISATKYVIEKMNNNDKVLENFVIETKRQNLLPDLIEALLEHPETFNVLGNLLNSKKGYAYCDSIVKGMTEAVGPPFGLDHDDEEMSDEEMPDEEGEESEEDEDGVPDEGDEGGEFGDEDEESDEEGMGDEEEMADEEGEDEEMGDGEDVPSDDGEEEDMGGPDGSMPTGKPHPMMNMMKAMKKYMPAY